MKLFILAAFLVACVAGQTSYEGYQLYQTIPKSNHELKVLNLFSNGEDHYDFWSEIRGVGQPVNVMVAPEGQKTFTMALDLNSITYTVLIEDVEKVFQAERLRQASAPKVKKGRISFDAYQRYDAIEEYLNQLAEDYPEIARVETIGQTYEGRNLQMIRIGSGSADNPTIFIDGGIHAREWAAPALVLYIIHQLVENEDNRGLISNVNWAIIPVLNPDGYEYSHTTTRLWRKTRSRGSSCYGADGNRNFDFHWMEVGASSNECSDTFAGAVPFSEVETAAFRDTVLKESNIALYLAIHSYGQYLLYPWGWTSALPDNADQLHALAVEVDNAISAVDGTRYTIGSSTNVLYAASGASDDWMYGVAGVKLSYTVELPGGGSFGFDLPASRILPVVQETWAGIVVFHDYVANNFSRN